jgi:hypothetical protein
VEEEGKNEMEMGQEKKKKAQKKNQKKGRRAIIRYSRRISLSFQSMLQEQHGKELIHGVLAEQPFYLFNRFLAFKLSLVLVP